MIYCSYRFGSKNVTCNDNNPTIVNFVRWVKNNPKSLLAISETQKEIRRTVLS